jgi:hypothetical protein
MGKMKETTMYDYPEEEIIESYPDYNQEEAFIYHIMADVDSIITTHGIDFFIEKLPRYSKIALLAWRKQK